MNVLNQVNNLMKKIIELKKDLDCLKNNIKYLEMKNEQFKIYLKNDIKRNNDKNNLIELHDKGFHVCHESFGEIREKDCLFCLNLKNKIK